MRALLGLVTWIGVIGVVLSTSACLAGATLLAVVSATDRDNGAQIVVPRTGMLEIRLATTPGTGYGWRLAQIDRRFLELVEVRIITRQQSPALGVEETHLFRIKAIGSGVTELALEYVRPWEKEVPALKTYRISIDIP